MELSRFSPAAFESLASDPYAARRLADELQAAVLSEVGAAAGERFMTVVAALNALGHRLTAYCPRSDGEQDVRDYTNPQLCALRLAMDIVISAGYKDVQSEGGCGELPRDDRQAERITDT